MNSIRRVFEELLLDFVYVVTLAMETVYRSVIYVADRTPAIINNSMFKLIVVWLVVLALVYFQ